MSPKQRISAIRLSERIVKNPEYAEKLGIEMKRKNVKIKRRINNELYY